MCYEGKPAPTSHNDFKYTVVSTDDEYSFSARYRIQIYGT